ncbi:MAG: class I SAM-dependent methyltransferase [Actinomycetes bacterium]
MREALLTRVRVPTRHPPATVIRRLHRRLARVGVDLPVRLPDGDLLGPDRAGYRIVVAQPSAVRALLLVGDDRAAGEAYVRGDVDVEGSMVAALRDLSRHVPALGGGRPATGLIADVLRLPRLGSDPAGRQPSLAGAVHSLQRDREAIRYHYDVGNDFYRLFLDRRLVYSCAYFPDGTPLDPPDGPDDGLDAAQARKLDLICRKLDLRPGERLLDIGCGWGALAIHAATHYGVEVVGVTLSDEQVSLARERAGQAGVDDRVEFRLADYREVTGTFDAVASIGMFEHVGTDQLDRYFTTCHLLTRPGGRFLNHGITTGQRGIVRDLAHDDGFLARYVFPDGALVPAHTAVTHLERAGFELVDLEQLRPHYARTLTRWVARLEATAFTARATADERTYRIWRAYMAASAVGFATGDLGVIQLLGVRPPGDLPLSRTRMLLPEPTTSGSKASASPATGAA